MEHRLKNRINDVILINKRKENKTMPLYLGNQKVGQLYLGEIPLFGSGGG